MRSVTAKELAAFRESVSRDPSVEILGAAMAKTSMADMAFIPMEAARLSGEFEIEISTHGITAQERSGRCWLYAAMNILREEVMKKTGLTEFALSGNYLAFYDKLEKANNVLEMAIEYAGLPHSHRMTEYILEGFHDGGYWDMAADLAGKYGAVPASAMPETYQSSHTLTFMDRLRTLVRKDVMELRALVREGKDPRPRKQEMMAEIYKAECIAFGTPPDRFDFDYRDKDGAYRVLRDMTPHSFYETFIGLDLKAFRTLTHHPTPALPMDFHYVFHYIGSMADSMVDNLNVTMDEIQEACLRQLRAGMPVWFGCDSDAHGDRKRGIWDPASVSYEGLMGGADLSMDKTTRLLSHDSYATHAMILTGVSFDADGNPARWKIENSWGGDVCRKGYFVCSQAYFREFVYEAIIHESFLTEAQKALFDQEPAVIPAWESDWA